MQASCNLTANSIVFIAAGWNVLGAFFRLNKICRNLYSLMWFGNHVLSLSPASISIPLSHFLTPIVMSIRATLMKLSHSLIPGTRSMYLTVTEFIFLSSILKLLEAHSWENTLFDAYFECADSRTLIKAMLSISTFQITLQSDQGGKDQSSWGVRPVTAFQYTV